MRDRQGGDASFLLGLVLGLFIGAAIALILSPATGEENRAWLAGKAEEAKNAIGDKADEAKDRVEGAAEGAAPA